jgi:hypothetical protein
MAARQTNRQAAARSSRQETPPRPPYYIATEPLFLDNQFSRAHNPGDMVPADHVEQYGWAGKVRPPDGYATAEEPADQPRKDEPDTAERGQATSSKEGEA